MGKSRCSASTEYISYRGIKTHAALPNDWMCLCHLLPTVANLWTVLAHFQSKILVLQVPLHTQAALTFEQLLCLVQHGLDPLLQNLQSLDQPVLGTAHHGRLGFSHGTQTGQ